MNSLKEVYSQDFSMSSFKRDKQDALTYNIVGKFCTISLDTDGNIDIWLMNPSDLSAGLSARKLNVILNSLDCSLNWTVLDGEAWAKTRDKEFIRNNSRLLGIRSRRNLSEEQLQTIRDRFAININFKKSG
jgi:hypothetical protein